MKLLCQLCNKPIENSPYVIKETDGEILAAAHCECWFGIKKVTLEDGGHEGLRV